MLRFFGRASSACTSGQRRKWHTVERLETRCVLSANSSAFFPAVDTSSVPANHGVELSHTSVAPYAGLSGNSLLQSTLLQSTAGRPADPMNPAALGPRDGQNSLLEIKPESIAPSTAYESSIAELRTSGAPAIIVESTPALIQTASGTIYETRIEVIALAIPNGNSAWIVGRDLGGRELEPTAVHVALSYHSDVDLFGVTQKLVNPAFEAMLRTQVEKGLSSSGAEVALNLAASGSTITSASANPSNPLPGTIVQTSPQRIAEANHQSTPLVARGIAPSPTRIPIRPAPFLKLGPHGSARDKSAATESSQVPSAPKPSQLVRGRTLEETEIEGASPADSIADMPETRGTLASLSLKLQDVQRALDTVLGEIELFGDDVTQWLDDVRLTPTELAIAAAVASAGAAYYLRRQESRPLDPRHEEASSNWLFARLQTVAGER